MTRRHSPWKVMLPASKPRSRPFVRPNTGLSSALSRRSRGRCVFSPSLPWRRPSVVRSRDYARLGRAQAAGQDATQPSRAMRAILHAALAKYAKSDTICESERVESERSALCTSLRSRRLLPHISPRQGQTPLRASFQGQILSSSSEERIAAFSSSWNARWRGKRPRILPSHA